MNLDREVPTASTTSSLQSMAARFQERVGQLSREESLLQQTGQSLQELSDLEQKEKQEYSKNRREFVSVRQESDAAEEMTLFYQESSAKLQQEIQRLQQEIKDYENGTEKLNEEYRLKNEESLIIPHRMKRVLYKEYLQGRVNPFAQADRIQEEKRKVIAKAIALLRQKRKEYEQETETIKTQTVEKRGEIAKLATQSRALQEKVKAVTLEKAQLTKDLRKARA